MATTYSARRAALTEITTRIQQNSKRLDQAEQLITVSEADLNSMPAQYGEFVNDINADAANNPGDAAFVLMADELGKLAAEFVALATHATALKNAVAAVE